MRQLLLQEGAGTIETIFLSIVSAAGGRIQDKQAVHTKGGYPTVLPDMASPAVLCLAQ